MLSLTYTHQPCIRSQPHPRFSNSQSYLLFPFQVNSTSFYTVSIARVSQRVLPKSFARQILVGHGNAILATSRFTLIVAFGPMLSCEFHLKRTQLESLVSLIVLLKTHLSKSLSASKPQLL